ncbi:hypothetical protein C4D60_Mb10t12610 [Musa balbisiana]|uniref:Uncharacterized protein n=1 Tax=Musa balbisiana TaxID=52838 RepID=A0A4S8IWQ6_MUSBA|nr:hypothetical protein C4D60_Mb10t12610 [Musa balbisiana]
MSRRHPRRPKRIKAFPLSFVRPQDSLSLRHLPVSLTWLREFLESRPRPMDQTFGSTVCSLRMKNSLASTDGPLGVLLHGRPFLMKNFGNLML